MVLVLVVVSRRPSATLTTEVATARRHAVTTSALSVVVALVSLAPVGAVLAGALPDVHVGVACIPLAVTAVALVVLLVGELTWPRPSGSSRVALLHDRSVRGLLRGAWPVSAAVASGLLAVTLLVTGSVAYDGRAVRHVRPDGADTASPFPGWTYGVAQLAHPRPSCWWWRCSPCGPPPTAPPSSPPTPRPTTCCAGPRSPGCAGPCVAGTAVTLGADLAVAGSAVRSAFDTGTVHVLGQVLVVAGPTVALLGLVTLAVPVPRLPARAVVRRAAEPARLRMTVTVTLDMLAATPPYEQVRSQIAGHIRTGNIRPGEKLPVVRVLAADLGVATNTIARAYRELEAGGLVTTRRRVGTIVQTVPSPAGAALQLQATTFVRDARNAGLADEEVVDLVRGR